MSVMPVTGLLIAMVAVIGALLASGFMWWATKGSGLWAMGSLLAFCTLAGALLIAWWMTWAAFHCAAGRIGGAQRRKASRPSHRPSLEDDLFRLPFE